MGINQCFLTDFPLSVPAENVSEKCCLVFLDCTYLIISSNVMIFSCKILHLNFQYAVLH